MKEVSLKKNIIMNALLTMSSIIFPLITFPYVSRILMPEGMGKIAFATSLVTYFSMFAQLGIPTYGIRACAQVRDDRETLTRTVHELLFINIVMNVIAYSAFFLALILVPRLQSEKPLYCIVSLTIILTSLGMEWLYKALEKYTYITVRSVAFKCIAVILMFMMVHSKDDYVIYGGISIFAASASNILNFVNSHKYIDYKWMKGYDVRRHLRPVLVFFAITCATTVYTNLDTVMLGFMSTDTDVGYYDAAIKIKNILVMLITSLSAVLLPRSSYYVEHGKMDEFWRISRKALNFTVIFAVPVSVFFMLFAKNAIYLLSGKAYTGSILPLQILMPTLLLIGLTNILGIQVLVPTDREKLVLYSVIAGAIVDVIINAILIPKIASPGAAIGTLIAETAVLGYQLYVLKDRVGFLFKDIHYLKICITIAICIGASIAVLMLDLANILMLIIGAIVFFGIYAAVMLLTKEPVICEVMDSARGLINKKGKDGE